MFQILVTYRISWKRTWNNFCNSTEDIENKKLKDGEGYLKVRAPSMPLARDVIRAKFACTDFSITEDWETGELSEFKMNYTGFVSSPFFYLG